MQHQTIGVPWQVVIPLSGATTTGTTLSSPPLPGDRANQALASGRSQPSTFGSDRSDCFSAVPRRARLRRAGRPKSRVTAIRAPPSYEESYEDEDMPVMIECCQKNRLTKPCHDIQTLGHDSGF